MFVVRVFSLVCFGGVYCGGVPSDVFKALNKTRGLYLRWRELGEATGTTTAAAAGASSGTAAAAAAAADTEWTTTELRNSLRSIEWDLEDLEDTINILFHEFDDAEECTFVLGFCVERPKSAEERVCAFLLIFLVFRWCARACGPCQFSFFLWVG